MAFLKPSAPRYKPKKNFLETICYQDTRFEGPDITVKVYNDAMAIPGPEQLCYLRERYNWLYPYGVVAFSCDKENKKSFTVKVNKEKHVSVMDLDTFACLVYDVDATIKSLKAKVQDMLDQYNEESGPVSRARKRMGLETEMELAVREFQSPHQPRTVIKSRMLLLVDNLKFNSNHDEDEEDVICDFSGCMLNIKLRSTNCSGGNKSLNEIEKQDGVYTGWGFQVNLQVFMDMLVSDQFKDLASFAVDKVDYLSKQQKRIPFYRTIFKDDSKKKGAPVDTKENRDQADKRKTGGSDGEDSSSVTKKAKTEEAAALKTQNSQSLLKANSVSE